MVLRRKTSLCLTGAALLFLALGLWLFYDREREVTPSFYYWKTEFSLSGSELSALENLKVKRLYLRLFDVGVKHDGSPEVLGPVRLGQPPPVWLEIVPTVFITERAMRSVPAHEEDEFCSWLAGSIMSIAKGLPFREIQLDCDWTDSSRESFFNLIKKLKKSPGFDDKIISVTLRLHQFRDAERTGVPPADRTVLMAYNMGDVDSKSTKNSILDLRLAAGYLKSPRPYPLPVSVAMPIFSWGVVTRRGEVVDLVNGVTAEELSSSKDFRKTSANIFEAVRSAYHGGVFFYEGDSVRAEGVGKDELLALAKLLKPVLRGGNGEVVFFSLTKDNLERMGGDGLEEIIENLR